MVGLSRTTEAGKLAPSNGCSTALATPGPTSGDALSTATTTRMGSAVDAGCRAGGVMVWVLRVFFATTAIMGMFRIWATRKPPWETGAGGDDEG